MKTKTTTTTTTTAQRPLYEIAAEISEDWIRQSLYIPSAAPYLQALCSLQDLEQHYGCDSAQMITCYLLGNLRTWKGETARRIKAELNAMLKAHNTRKAG